jgi:hypothetical protein
MASFEAFTVAVMKTKTQKQYEIHKLIQTDRLTECYIESTADEQFEITFLVSDKPRFWRKHQGFTMDIFVDGNPTEAFCLTPPKKKIPYEMVSKGIITDKNTIAVYRFGKRTFLGRLP